ncbi:hypothetical protein [Streptomyces sp. NPDC059009]|uniref:hypothetical protein n=1 Tax=Streptomyces sp. NPDC059009 TaxID=3346694 RepID=UPI0036771CCE
MSTAQHLAEIDLLLARAFPAEVGRSARGFAGPGYHVAELAESDGFWEDDGSRWTEAEEQFEAERDGLSQLLTARWGKPDEFALYSLLHRMVDGGEEIPEPWADLSSHVPNLHLWRVDGRWIALGVSQWDKELPFQLLAVVTEVDPP